MEKVRIECTEKRIGDSVRIGDGTEIRCKKLYLGDMVVIGKNSHIEGETVTIGDYTIIEDGFTGNGIEHFEIGKHCRIRSNSTIKARYVKIDDNVRTFGRIDVGGGGWQDPKSKFIVGNGCQIGDNCFINTAMPVIFKDRSALAMGSAILTHGFWQSVLEGYSAVYGPVILGENSWVAANCTVLPNVMIGDNTIVAAGAVVNKSIPPNCLASGVPAKVLKREYPTKPTDAQKREIMLDVIKRYVPFLEIRQYSIDKKRLGEGVLVFNDSGGKEFRIIFSDSVKDLGRYKDRALILGFGTLEYDTQNATFFNLRNLTVQGKCDKESERLRNHLRRHGIVFDFVDYQAPDYASKYYCIFD